MNGVLDALKHSYLLASENGGDDLDSTIFYLTVFLYRKTLLNVKKKIKNLVKKQVLIMNINYLL